MKDKIGSHAFVLGVVLAVAIGIISVFVPNGLSVLLSILIILGLIVGFLNITDMEVREFLEISTMLVIVSYAGQGVSSLSMVLWIGPYLGPVFNALMVFIVPATIVVALKEVWRIGKKH